MPQKPFMPQDANTDVYKKEWQYQEGEYTVTRTTHWSGPGCHDGCGVLIYTKDGKVEKIEGDPQNPYNNGRLCMRCLNMPEAINHPDRLKYPMKRAGERGENKWERISWDEAYDMIENKVREIWATHGPESIVSMEGTGRNVIWQVPYLSHAAFKSPNFCLGFLSGSACYLPRSAAAHVQNGEQQIADCSQTHPLRYDDPNYKVPEVLVLWGNNPLPSNPDNFFGHWVVDLMKLGTKLITIDPSLTWLASKSEYWLRIRPGTDSAMAMAWANICIKEDLLDHDFIDNWTYGFDEFAKGVAEMTPEKAEEICWVPKEKIIAAARMYGQAKVATVQWGLAIDQQAGGIAAAHGIAALTAITGNLDTPGGNMIMKNAYKLSIHYSIGVEEIDPDVWDKRLGAGLSTLYEFGSSNAQEDSVLKAMEEGKPYPIDMVWLQSTNPIACMGAEAPRVYEAMKKVPFVVNVDMYMTPTSVAFADLLLPAGMSCERNSIRAWWTPLRAINKVSQYYECKSDEEIIIEIGKRLNPEIFGKFKDDIDYLNWNLSGDGIFPGNFLDLREKVFDFWDFLEIYEKYKKGLLRGDGEPGFETPTGKFELSCTLFEAADWDSVPYHIEPHMSPYSTPEMYKDYPLIMTTGQRSWEFFHSEHRQLPSHRAQHPDPMLDMHPDAAAKYGLKEGDWAWVENHLGRFKQKVKFNASLDPRVIRAEHGWWFPEKEGAEPVLFDVFDCNSNNCIPQFHNGPTGMSADYKCVLVKVYPVTGAADEIMPTTQVIKLGGFINYDDYTKNDYGNYGQYGKIKR